MQSWSVMNPSQTDTFVVGEQTCCVCVCVCEGWGQGRIPLNCISIAETAAQVGLSPFIVWKGQTQAECFSTD